MPLYDYYDEENKRISKKNKDKTKNNFKELKCKYPKLLKQIGHKLFNLIANNQVRYICLKHKLTYKNNNGNIKDLCNLLKDIDSNVVDLDLSDNLLNDESILHLLSTDLVKNKSLKKLNIDWNKLTDESLNRLSELLQNHTTITQIILGVNQFSAQGVNDFIEMNKNFISTFSSDEMIRLLKEKLNEIDETIEILTSLILDALADKDGLDLDDEETYDYWYGAIDKEPEIMQDCFDEEDEDIQRNFIALSTLKILKIELTEKVPALQDSMVDIARQLAERDFFSRLKSRYTFFTDNNHTQPLNTQVSFSDVEIINLTP